MADLPPEIDFERDNQASPARMNRAMAFLFGLYSTVAALRPEYELAIAQIESIGLQRLVDVLQPIFINAQQIEVQLESIRDSWVAENVLVDLQEVLEGHAEQLIDDLAGALNPQIAALQAADTDLTAQLAAAAADRWFNAHG